MDTRELEEVAEKAQTGPERRIGLSMGIFAACLAVATLLGHRAHTEEVILQTRVTDGWAYYQAKNGRSHMYNADAELAHLLGQQGEASAANWREKGDTEKKEAEAIRQETQQLEAETHQKARQANFYDAAEIVLEISIVLCSIALLTGAAVFWYVSFAIAAVGVAIGSYGQLLR